MMIGQRLIAVSSLGGLLFALGAGSALAEKDCGAWNNWCRPACGDWNAWCAGEPLPDVLSRMQPRSYFADPKWVGETYPLPKNPNADRTRERRQR